MLSWTKHITNVPHAVRSYSARTNIGTAIIHERPDGQVQLVMWKPDQSNIGAAGTFPNVAAAKTRAETILDPRATGWDMLDHPELDETG